MATSYTYLTPTTTASDTIDVAVADTTKLVLQDTTKVSGGYVSEYLFSEGDADHPLRVIVKNQVTNNGEGGSAVARMSITLHFWQKTTITDMEDTYLPASSVIAWNLPGGLHEPDELVEILGTLLGLVFETSTVNVMDYANLTQMAFGISAIY